MTLRADHVAGASSSSRFGVCWSSRSAAICRSAQLSMPGSGFLPKIVAAADHRVRRGADACARAESQPFAELAWSDGKHAALVRRDHRGRHRALRAARLHHHHDADDVRAADRHRAAQRCCRAAVYSVGVVGCHLRLVRLRAEDAARTGPFGF